MAEHYFNRGRVRQFKRDYNDLAASATSLGAAIADYTRALEINPRFALAYYKRGQAQRDLQHVPSAIRDFEAAIAFDPEFGLGYESLAYILATDPDSGNRDGLRAVQLAQKAMSLVPEQFKVCSLETMAAAYAEAGDFDAAIRWITKAIEEFPAYEDIFLDDLVRYQNGIPAREE